MIKIEIFINEVSLKGQYPTQQEFEIALKVLKSIFELINTLKQENISKKTYYTEVLLNYESIKGKNFQASFNQISDKSLKRAIINIIFNKTNPKDWQTEQVHFDEDNFDYFDGEDYEDVKNTSLAEVTERQLTVGSKYLLINFKDSQFKILHQNINDCCSIQIIKNNDERNKTYLDSTESKTGLENWLEKNYKLSQFQYDESSSSPPADYQTILKNSSRFEKIGREYDGRSIYREKETAYYWYIDNLHCGKKAHLEVFYSQGKKHLGESDLEGNIDSTKSDPNKRIDKYL
ncbi:hypothetical protein GM3708_22 [Geminocystis sp. NIES-3708]|uniref:hypothetical protein n=1 Tax=Geminocystis sp. NIES-3708 TaxID=1615909 RepID=UPI0005FC5E31|nr:hypothetical protein [Geminocystis sp. NIES-3708]BAQ59617.1 hypothetical protein GM3708_22 [Geminocystis sp. NIES-3708]